MYRDQIKRKLHPREFKICSNEGLREQKNYETPFFLSLCLSCKKKSEKSSAVYFRILIAEN